MPFQIKRPTTEKAQSGGSESQRNIAMHFAINEYTIGETLLILYVAPLLFILILFVIINCDAAYEKVPTHRF